MEVVRIFFASLRNKDLKGGNVHTGTVYKTFGFGLSSGHCSKIVRNEDDLIPFESVSTSTRRTSRIPELIR